MELWKSRAVAFGLAMTCVAICVSQSLAQAKLERMEITSGEKSLESIAGKRVDLSGNAILKLTGKPPKIGNGQIHFSPYDLDAVVEFKNVQPSIVQKKFLASIFVDDQPAVHGENVRLTPTPTGTILFPHGPKYAALKTFNAAGMKGESREYVVHKYYKSKELGEDNDRIHSFLLKKGYMATFAENENGTGASQVFIAHDKDLKIADLPAKLKGKVSFVRVFPWRYTGKKGFGGKLANSELLQTQWRYDWGAGGKSTLDMEYVPMRYNAVWPPFKKINQIHDVTHLLGFNEPNQSDQANMSVEKAIKMWPKLQASGLRLGSPSPNDADRGLNWLYEFMEEADKQGLRVDFIPVHYYKANWSDEKLISWLRKIHKKTGGRPIWLTEFNNGAPWTKGHNPSYAENTKKLNEYCKIMDATGFVERYAIFNLGPDTKNRQLIKKGELTPTGKWYEGYSGAEAFKPK